MSRTRLIRPAFFSDERMAQLTIPSRLVYIGLWTMTDDAGFLDASVREIGAELFRFDTPTRRETRVRKALDELVAIDRIEFLDCGEHAVIRTITDHRTQGGEKVYTIRNRHTTRCLTPSDVARRSPTETSVSDSVSDSSSGSVSLDAQARPRSLHEAAARAGGAVARFAKVPA